MGARPFMLDPLAFIPCQIKRKMGIEPMSPFRKKGALTLSYFREKKDKGSRMKAKIGNPPFFSFHPPAFILFQKRKTGVEPATLSLGS